MLVGHGTIPGPSHHISAARFSPLMELGYLTFQNYERKNGGRENGKDKE